jgi:hypothetical protein
MMIIFKIPELSENCALLDYYAASSGNSWQKFRNKLLVQSSRVNNPICCPETLRSYHYSLRNNTVGRSFRPFPGESLKSWVTYFFEVQIFTLRSGWNWTKENIIDVHVIVKDKMWISYVKYVTDTQAYRVTTAKQVLYCSNIDNLAGLLTADKEIWLNETKPLKTKRRPLYLKAQSVPRCKHLSSRL